MTTFIRLHPAIVAAIALVAHSTAFAVEKKNQNPGQNLIGPGPAISDSALTDLSETEYPGHTSRLVGLLQTGRLLPTLEISDGGEIQLVEDEVVQKPWSSEAFEGNGKVQLIQYVAANRGVVRKNKPFTQAVLAKNYSPEELDTTVIVHLADTISFARGLVVNKLADEEAKRPSVGFVVDNAGVGLQRWGMKHKSCATILLDSSGKVVFAKDGPLSGKEIEHTINLLERYISLSNSPLIMASK